MINAPSKPYLERIDSVEKSATVLEWAKYLSETFGTSGALSSLRYYERIGWITPDVRKQMVSFLRGLSLEELHNKKYDEPATLDRPLDTLSGTPFGAHARSLEFIAEIGDHDLEEQRILARLAEHRVENTDPDVSQRGSGTSISLSKD